MKPVVERIKALKGAGQSLRAVAATLNEERVPTRNGKQWAAQTVANVLKHNLD